MTKLLLDILYLLSDLTALIFQAIGIIVVAKWWWKKL